MSGGFGTTKGRESVCFSLASSLDPSPDPNYHRPLIKYLPAKFCSDDFSCTFRYSRNSSRQLFSQALSDRNPHVYWLACRSTSRPAGRKTRIGPKRSPIASNHAEREQTCCMREPMGKCHPLAMTACSRRRLTRHRREEAGESEHEPSLLSAKQVAYYNAKVTINHDNLTDH